MIEHHVHAVVGCDGSHPGPELRRKDRRGRPADGPPKSRRSWPPTSETTRRPDEPSSPSNPSTCSTATSRPSGRSRSPSRPARVVTLIGANGAGKSTTLRAVVRPPRPAGGGVSSSTARTSRVGPRTSSPMPGLVLVPEGRQLWPAMTVLENLRDGRVPERGPRAGRRDARRGLRDVPAFSSGAIAQKAGTLSGGEQQMCAIGRGLMARPRLLLLDEPALGLSPLLVREVFASLRGHPARAA